MYLFREKTSLGRFKSDRVGFMNCLFSMHIKNEFEKFRQNKRSHKWDTNILSYANGALPSHGKTGKKWALDFDRIYAPIFVNGNHWISVCINFCLRTIEVFDCHGHQNRRPVEPFATLIPRILKEIQTKSYGKNLHLALYSIVLVSVPPNLNKSSCDCGVYALKYIECHLLQLDMSLINGENIREARMRIAVDLWEASYDHVFIIRMEKYEPPHITSSEIVEL